MDLSVPRRCARSRPCRRGRCQPPRGDHSATDRHRFDGEESRNYATYNPQVARSSFKVLRKQNAKELKVHDYTRLMRQSLINFLELHDQIDKLKTSNASLQEDLKKREEALKKLRDLTLSQ